MSAAGPNRLTLERVSVRAGRRMLLEDVTLQLSAGELVALVGPNGAGKTTVLRTALGLLRTSSGRVTLSGVDVRGIPPRARAALIGWLPQQQGIYEPLTAVEVVSAARYRFDEPRSRALEQAWAALERLRARALGERPITQLSGGERQRVRLAALLAQGAELLLLDEPASHLDPAQQLETYRLIGELWRSGLGVLLVTHDVNLMSELGHADRIRLFGLADGHVRFESTYGASDLPLRLSGLFGVGFTALEHAGRRILLPGAAEP